MTAVIYARYSSDNQREESIEGQIRECTAYAEKNGITVIKHYIDRAFSAKTDNRPEFQQMIKDSGKKLFDVVLVWKFDRFARNRFDSANYKMILKKNGVHLISVMEPIAEGSQGILVETLLEGMAEYYSAELSEKVIRGQTENALKGKCTGGTGTIGYKIDEDKFYHLDPLTAPLVLEAFQRVLNKRKYAQPVILEGYTKFLFLNRNGLPKVAVNYESMFRGLVRKYTKTQKVALPKVMTPHTLRHTFCTTLANAGMNPKALQYIMGHSNINMTLNYYAHTTSETSITEMKRLIA